jgi:hypothetical protein
MSIRLASLAILAFLVVACEPFWDDGTTKPLDQIPGPSEIQAIGIITGESQRDTIVEFTLADGRVIEVDLKTRRRVGQVGGSPALLVLGRDSHGAWISEPGHQDGLPDSCKVLAQDGFELGDSIAIDGVRWFKAPGFVAPTTPEIRYAYPAGSRFCLDEQARVTDVIAP